MNKEVIARIDVSTPEGRRIVRELEKEDSVKIEMPDKDGDVMDVYTHKEVFTELREKLKEYYQAE